MSEVTQKDKELEEIKSYIGTKRYDIIRKLSKEEKKIFSKINMENKGTYLVEGPESALLKFKACFLWFCASERPAYCQHMIKEYVDNSMNRSTDDFFSNLDSELTFLYCHKESVGIGKTEQWVESFVLNRLTERNRKGLTTVILTERTLPIIQNSSEVKYIDLATPFKAVKIKTSMTVASNTSSEVTTGTIPTEVWG